MKNGILVTLIVFLVCGASLFAEDVYFTNRAESLYVDHDSRFGTVARLDEGTVIASFTSVSWATTGTDPLYIIKVQTESGLSGWLAADAISVKDSAELPAEITDYDWMQSYFLDVLRSGDRERLFVYEPFWRDYFVGDGDYDRDSWTGYAQYPSTMLFRNIFMWLNEWRYNYFQFINGRIEENDGAYLFDAVCVKKMMEFEEISFGSQFTGGEAVKFMLRPDGDYLDVYVNGTKMFSLVRLTEEISNQFINLVRVMDVKPPVDLSGIKWPVRADGSMDFPPPDGTTVPDFQASQKTHGELALPIRPRDRQSRSQTTDRLRVRENPDTGSAVVTTLDTGTEVQILETGTEETISGITAPWVKVLSENGFTGWAFSGYLETLNPETANLKLENLDSENQERENVETQNLDSENLNPENQKSSFPVLPLAIAGSVILVAGIVTTVVLAKRKKASKTNV